MSNCRWEQDPAVVNAFYNPNTNDIGKDSHIYTSTDFLSYNKVINCSFMPFENIILKVIYSIIKII